MNIVWRLEGDDGIGPYVANNWAIRNLAMRHFSNDRQPGGTNDFCGRGVSFSKDEIFGFKSREQAIEWFGEDVISTLELHNFRLKQVPAVKVIESISGKQIVFVRDKNLENSIVNSIIIFFRGYY